MELGICLSLQDGLSGVLINEPIKEAQVVARLNGSVLGRCGHVCPGLNGIEAVNVCAHHGDMRREVHQNPSHPIHYWR